MNVKWFVDLVHVGGGVLNESSLLLANSSGELLLVYQMKTNPSGLVWIQGKPWMLEVNGDRGALLQGKLHAQSSGGWS